MTENDPVQRKLAALVAKRGGQGSAHQYHRILAEMGDDVFDAYDGWYSIAMLGRSQDGLDARTRELVVVALAALGRDGDALQMHAKKAINMGVSPSELYEAVLITGVTGGMPCLKVALPALAEVVPVPNTAGHVSPGGRR